MCAPPGGSTRPEHRHKDTAAAAAAVAVCPAVNAV